MGILHLLLLSIPNQQPKHFISRSPRTVQRTMNRLLMKQPTTRSILLVGSCCSRHHPHRILYPSIVQSCDHHSLLLSSSSSSAAAAVVVQQQRQRKAYYHGDSREDHHSKNKTSTTSPGLLAMTTTAAIIATGFGGTTYYYYYNHHDNNSSLFNTTIKRTYMEGRSSNRNNGDNDKESKKKEEDVKKDESSSYFDITTKHFEDVKKDGSEFLRKLRTISDEWDTTKKARSSSSSDTSKNDGSATSDDNDTTSKDASTAENPLTNLRDRFIETISQSSKAGNSSKEPSSTAGQGQPQNNNSFTFEDITSTVKDLITLGKGSGIIRFPGSSSGGGSGRDKPNKQVNEKEKAATRNTLDDIIDKARSYSEQGDINDKSQSVTEVLQIVQRASQQLDSTLDDFFDGEFTTQKLPSLHPSNLYYYLEYEDSLKNASWKRRVHRYNTQGINIDTLDELNAKLVLSKLSYSDNVDEIRAKLETQYNCELLYCQLESSPGRPAHFIAVQKPPKAAEAQDDDSSNPILSTWNKISSTLNVNKNDGPLEVILVVRGTKTIGDVITDLICDAAEYRNGTAHAGILDSGKYLATRHEQLIEQLLELSKEKAASGSGRGNNNATTMKLTLIGHSLGAGAASIAGMEWRDKFVNNNNRNRKKEDGTDDDGPNLDLHVYGFGCPALLSQNISESTREFITTIVADYDCIPRMSTATLLNAILNIGEYNWLPYARRDIKEFIEQVVQPYFPLLISESNKSKILQYLDDIMSDPSMINIPTPTQKRMNVTLYPPGTCIHLYTDGYGVSGAQVPCTFFNELDISRRMIDDHLFHTGYERIFLELMRQHHQNHHFQFITGGGSS